jgi:regulator of replication initiation timing
MVKQALARTVDLDPIDRLEEKVKLLVNVVTRLRTEQVKTAEENARLTEEIEALRERLADVQGVNTEVDALRHEREAIRQRVAEMLSHLEAL